MKTTALKIGNITEGACDHYYTEAFDNYIKDSIRDLKRYGYCYCHTQEQINEIRKTMPVIAKYDAEYDIYRVERKI